MISLLLFVIAVVCIVLAFRGGLVRPARPRRVRPPRRPRVDVPHWMYEYRCRWGRGRRYIGISSDLRARHRRHEKRSVWFCRSTGVMYVIAQYPNFTTAHADEVAAIKTACADGEPIENRAHVPGRIRRRAR